MKTKSITIHGINNELDRNLRRKSKELNLSRSGTIKKILEESLLEKNKSKLKKNEFAELFGIWSKEDKKEFDENLRGLREIDKDEWE